LVSPQDCWSHPRYVKGYSGLTEDHIGLETLFVHEKPTKESLNELIKTASSNPEVGSVKISIFKNHEKRYEKVFSERR
jgi:hypothetical protein